MINFLSFFLTLNCHPDIFLGLMGTCRKLGISFGEYLKDRFYHRYELPPLGDLIWIA